MAKLIKRDEQPADLLESMQPAAQGADAPAPDPEIVSAKSEAERIIAQAEAKANKLVAEATERAQTSQSTAQTEADEAKSLAHKEGLQAGREAGLAEYVAAALAANQDSAALRDEVVPQLTTLAMRIARRILGRELEFHPEAVVEIVKQALGDKARLRREITLRVHPSDAQFIRDSREELTEMLSRTKQIFIREDEEVKPHGVIIETEAGVIDAQLETQLGAFEALLRSMQ